MKSYQLFATAPKAMDALLLQELESIGCTDLRPTVAGVSFTGTLEIAYRACLWSRCANRILLKLNSFQVSSQEDLYQGIQRIDWSEHIMPDASIAVSFSSKNSPEINNTHFGALKVKDAIIDQMRAKFDQRPSIDTEQPDLRINVYLVNQQAQVSIDLSGDSLHRRGYRDSRVPAPLKENLAAAMLLRAGWPEIAAKGGTLIDPMCGSGTLLIEAALIAADIAPGIKRKYYGFLGWKKHQPDIWLKLLNEAEQRKQNGLDNIPVMIGYDENRRAINASTRHLEAADLTSKIHLETREIGLASPADSWRPGLLICNPPYGERLSDEQAVLALYQQFGEILKQHFIGWQAAMIISNGEYGFRLGIRSQKPVTLYNGAIECKLLRMRIEESAFFTPKALNRQQRVKDLKESVWQSERSPGALMFHNRLTKNLKLKSKWAKRNEISCYRLYDADLPEYSMAIDIYHCDVIRVHVQEYQAPKSIDTAKADTRLAEALAEIPKVLSIPAEQVYYKVRKKQKNNNQYEKLENSKQFYTVREGNCQFLVNFENYLDTGMFLDHRPMRLTLHRACKDKTFLNLFAYTGTATVHAAIGGAKSTTSVDLSNTYLEWINRNLELNGAKGNHEMIQANCLEWLEQQAGQPTKHYDVIFLDPPTFSNSKRMTDSFDIQQQHVELVNHAMQLLAPGGTLYFSTNFRRFKLDEIALQQYQIKDISKESVPEDFKRNPKIHYCWSIQA